MVEVTRSPEPFQIILSIALSFILNWVGSQLKNTNAKFPVFLSQFWSPEKRCLAFKGLNVPFSAPASSFHWQQAGSVQWSLSQLVL